MFFNEQGAYYKYDAVFSPNYAARARKKFPLEAQLYYALKSAQLCRKNASRMDISLSARSGVNLSFSKCSE